MIMIWLTCSRILRHPGNHLARPWCTLWGPEYTWTSWFCQIFPPCQLGRKCCSYIMYRCTGVSRSNIFSSNMLQILPSFISRYQKSEIPKGFFFKMWYVHIRDDEYVFFSCCKNNSICARLIHTYTMLWGADQKNFWNEISNFQRQ